MTETVVARLERRTPRRGASRARSLLRYLVRALHDTPGIARILVLSVLLQIFAVGPPLATSVLVDRIVPRHDHQLFAIMLSSILGLLVFNFVTTLVRAQLLLQLRTRLDMRLTSRFVEHLVSLPWSFFQGRLVGDLLMRWNSHTTLRELLTDDMLSGLLDGVLVTSYLLVIFVVDTPAGLLVAALGVVQVCFAFFARRRLQALLSLGLQAQARSEGYQVEMLNGIESIKAAGAESRAIDAWTQLFGETLQAGVARGRVAAVVEAFSSTQRVGAPLALLGWGTWQVLQAQMSLGTMLGLNALALGFLRPLASMVKTASKLQLLTSYFERVAEVMAEPPEQAAHQHRRAAAMGRIELDQISFRYSNLMPWAVRNVSLEIKPGQFVAIVGPSGSGKSTLARLMLGLHSPQQGCVRLDGLDLSTLELGPLRRSVGVALQHAHLFSTTLRANITLNDPTIGLDAVVAAAKLAQIHDEICAMPMGYDTAISASGSALSGGQRQRIALARALLHRPALLLLDEATSALDTVTERKVQDALQTLATTRIVVAHRLSTIRAADLIVVMDGGRVVERGRHDALYARAGVYRTLVEAQLTSPSQHDAAPARDRRRSGARPMQSMDRASFGRPPSSRDEA